MKPVPPIRAGGPAVSPAPAGPAPVVGWGAFAGALAAWGAFVLARHWKDLGFREPLRILGSVFGPLDRTWPPAGEVLAAWGQHAWHLWLGLLLAAAAVGAGRRALQLLRWTAPVRGLATALQAGGGYALLGLAMLGAGLVGLWQVWLPIGLILGGLVCLRRAGSGPDAAGVPEAPASDLPVPPVPPKGVPVQPPPDPTPFWLRPIQAVAWGTGLLWILVALAPEVFYDSLVYHTADPFNWIKAHKVHHLPYNFFSNFPFTFEMLFGAGLLLGHDAMARLAHAGISLAAAGLVGATAAWLGGHRAAGWIAAAAFMTIPLISGSAWMTGIDAGLVLYEVAAVAGVLIWWTTVKPGQTWLAGQPHALWLAAAFAGLGMGAKYTLGMTAGLLSIGVAVKLAAPDDRRAARTWLALIIVPLIPVTLANVREVRETAWLMTVAKPMLGLYALAGITALGMTISRWGWPRSVRAIGVAFVFGVTSLALVSPWMWKSLFLTGNPVYPFAYEHLGGLHISPPRMAYQMGEFREFTFRPAVEWLTHPWVLMKMSGLSNNSACGALAVVFLPALLLFRNVGLPVRLLAIASLGRYLLWANVSNIVRYFAPGLALLAILAGVLTGGWARAKPAARTAGLLVVLGLAAVNTFGSLLVAGSSVQFFWRLLGQDPERDFMLRQRSSYPAPSYLACEAMNRGLPRDAGVLFVGEARGSFWKGRLIAATVFDRPPVLRIFSESRDLAQAQRRLRQLKATHVMFNSLEARRIAGYRLFDWPDARSRALFEAWWTGRLRRLWSVDYMDVYAIESGGVKPATAPLHLVHAPFDEFERLQALESRAIEAMSKGRIDEARGLADELVKAAPGVAGAHEIHAQALAYAGKPREALAAFRRAESLGLVSAHMRRNIAIVLQQLGRTAESLQAFREAADLPGKLAGGI